MKKIKISALAFVLIASYSCNTTTEKVEETTSETTEVVNEEKTGLFSVVEDSTKVSFTAYKTSEKIGVGGEFTEVNVYGVEEGKSAFETMNNSKFSIPVSSLFTNDATETRDAKILKFFFGVMNNTSVITGTFLVTEDNSCSIDLKINDQTVNVPLTYTTNDEGTHFAFDGTLNLEDFDALNAVTSLNKACEALHTGADGVSKTWNDVAIHAEVLFEQK